MAYYTIGLDGGGTKTEAVLLSKEGKIIKTARLGALNPVSYPESPANIAEELKQYINENCLAICAACAGAGDKTKAWQVENALKTVFHGSIYVRTDGENALYTAHGEESGVIVISGTGSVCYGQNRGITARSGGRGNVFDDGGSGYAIGRDILRAVVRASDGRGEKTKLSEALFNECGTNDIAAITARYTSCPKSDIAALAPLTDKLCDDKAAVDIMNTAARELADMAAAVINTLKLTNPRVAFTGSTVLNSPTLYALSENAILARFPNAVCFKSAKNAALGAAEYAWSRERD
jgi:N-acetylglucosamine kinase-like BadF-type ATPase